MKKLKILWLETSDLYGVKCAQEAAERLGVQIDAVDPYDLRLAADGDMAGIFAGGKSLADSYDALVVRSFIPLISEALTLARLFHEAGKPVIDECITDEAYVISKMHDYIVLGRNGVAVPRTLQCADTGELTAFAGALGYPCIVKGIHGLQGRHVHKADSEKLLRRRLMQYRPGEVMVQEFLDAPVDYRVMVIGYRALPVYVSRRPRPGDFRTNFEYNEEAVAHPLSEAPQLRDLAERAARSLRREFSGVDIRCRGEAPVVLEANRRPGFKDFERVTGYDVAGAFIEYVKKRCEEH